MGRYNVNFKKFTTGEWYTKTDTDNLGAAMSVTKIGNYGRECNLIDTLTNKILYHEDEDADLKAVNGDVSKLKFK